MPLTVPPVRTKRISFFYGMVTGEFASYRTYSVDMQVREAYNSLATPERPRIMRDFFDSFATCLVITQDLKFHWATDDAGKAIVPDDIRNFEKFWAMVKSGQPILECFDYFSEEVAHAIFSGDDDSNFKSWLEVVKEALIVWQPPPEWKLEDELTAEERNDPF